MCATVRALIVLVEARGGMATPEVHEGMGDRNALAWIWQQMNRPAA